MKNIIIVILIALLNFSCNKKKDFNNERTIVLDWLSAIKDLNYDLYKKKVAYPRDINVFKAMYQDYYIEFSIITKIEEKSDKVYINPDRYKYYQRKLYFNGKIKMRNQIEKDMLLQADVLLIKFIDGERKDDGWLISNRTFLRIPLN